jgi:VWFA-related protein
MLSKRAGIWVATGLWCWGAIAGQADGQTPAGKTDVPAIKVTTHLVVLSVVVNDKSGKPITKLNRENFTVLENGARQVIDAFETPASLATATEMADGVTTSGTGPARTVAANVEQPRTILVLDELNTISEDTMFAAKQMQRYLQAQPPVLKQPTAIYLLTKRRLESFAESTRDRDRLLARLKTNFIELPPHNLESGGAQGGADRLVTSLMALGEIALANAEQKGRKNVIWIGNGIPILSGAYISREDRTKFDNWVHYTANWLEETETTVYTVDPRGVEVSPATIATGGYLLEGGIPSAIVGPDLTSSELVFEAIAPESGGAILRHRNDIDGAIGAAVDDGGSYYTLSYYPTDRNWDGKFRRIQVKVEGVERADGLVVRTQRGYYAYPEGFQSESKQIDFALSRAVTSPVPFKSVAFTASGERIAVAAAQKNAKAQLPAARLILAIDREGLSWAPETNGEQRAEVTLVTSQLSSSGKVLAYKVRELEVVLTKTQGPNEPVKLSVRTDVPAKTDRIRLVLRDGTSGRLGTVDLATSSLSAANTGHRQKAN